MENKICLDSDFLIDFLKNKKESVEWVKNNQEAELATTDINVFELYYGEYKKKGNVENLENFLKNFNILELNSQIAKKAGEIAARLENEGEIIEFRDIFIAATAFYHNHKIKTNNKKHFERINEIILV